LPADLPNLRDVLAYCALKEEMGLKVDRSVCQSVAEEILAIYRRVNSSIILTKAVSITNRIQEQWNQKKYFDRSACVGVKRQNFLKKLDSLFEVTVCRCLIQSCEEVGCVDDCELEAHIICSCLPLENKIPKTELKFFLAQRHRGSAPSALQIGSVDFTTTNQMQRRDERKEKEMVIPG
jgi:hypothetical protein